MLAAVILFAQVGATAPVEARLRRDFAEVPGVRFSHDGDTLVVKYRTVKVKVPKGSKARAVMREQVAEERPMPTGFILETYEFQHKPTEPARPMQAVREDPNWVRNYGTWKMDAGDRQVVGADKARYYYFEWGSKTDPRIVALIKKAIGYGTKALN